MKSLQLTYAQAYISIVLITIVKKACHINYRFKHKTLLDDPPFCLYYKSFTIVICDRNDIMLIEPVLLNYYYNCNLRYKP
jgi:hypothetical protein